MAIANKSKTSNDIMWNYIHVAIGFAIMFGFPQFSMPPVTPIGMWIMGVFLGMIYMWSTLNSTWPSILGLLVLGLVGYAGPGYKGLSTVALNAYGETTVLITLFAMVLFGAAEYFGCSQYIARWFLTRPIINGRPYVFMAVFYSCCYVLAALTSPITSLFIAWAIAADTLALLKVEKHEKLYPVMIAGTFWASTVGQPTLPFKGAELIIVSAYQKMSGLIINQAVYILFAVLMSILLIGGYMLLTKFLYRPDITKLKAVSIEQFNANPLPPMNIRQKVYLYMIPIYIFMLLAPQFIPHSVPGVKFLNDLGVLGTNCLWIVALCLIPTSDGKPILPFKEVASKMISWDVFFLIAAAVYAANAVSNPETGITKWLVQVLTPLLGDANPWFFAFLLLLFALVLTNFANNAAMAVVLMPIIITFTAQKGLPSMPFAMGVLFMVFIAMLTPSASPHAGMMHGRKDLISTGDIIKIGLPACILGLILYTAFGYPLSRLLFG